MRFNPDIPLPTESGSSYPASVNSLRRRGVVAAFVSPRESDRDDFPDAVDTDELEGVHAAVAEAIAQVKLVVRPEGGQITVDAHLRVPHPFARLGGGVDDRVDKRIRRSHVNKGLRILCDTDPGYLGRLQRAHCVSITRAHRGEKVVRHRNNRSAIGLELRGWPGYTRTADDEREQDEREEWREE